MNNNLTIAEVEYLAYRLAKKMLGWDEPIPEFNSRFPNVLESCLTIPFQTFSKKSLYPSMLSRTAILFYLMIKNHPFQNGNKRIAITTLLTYLYKHDKWLKVDTKELYNFTRWVAESNPKLKDETVKAVEKFIKTYLDNRKRDKE